MIDLNHTNEWQYRDQETCLVFPWYTKPALDEIMKWDLSDKIVFEYGLGASTIWWCNKVKKVYGVENDEEFYLAVSEKIWQRVEINLNSGNGFINTPISYKTKFDIIIIDGILREQCVPVALQCIKPGGKLIYDNWMQPSVEVQSEETQALLLKYPHTIYKQPNHPDWQTAIFTIQ